MMYLKTLTIGGREFPCAADASATVVYGGLQNTRLMNGDGTSKSVKQAIPWKLSGAVIRLDPDRGDIEYLNSIQSGGDTDIVATDMQDISYQGTGNIEGELPEDTATESTTIELTGGGKLEKM
jgi:hypothetical protein